MKETVHYDTRYDPEPVTLSLGVNTALGCICIRAKAKVKATSLPICCINPYLCVYTAAMSERQKIKENYHFRSNINATLTLRLQSPLFSSIRAH